ncbi:MAG: T9SS type A sorting domain-containing protein [Bacteroidales bacterium]|nr:T9SS type A sorting domain-containing protein [Bacteroidales bacterium]
MMKMTLLWINAVRFVLAAFLLTCWLPVDGQVTVTRDDMPNVGDTIRMSSTPGTAGIDYALTGENYHWDFSALVPVSQQIDTFVSVSSTPFLYRIVFTSSVASIARPEPDVDFIPDYPVTDVFTYFKESDVQFHEAGVALTLSGLPLPVKYDEPDVLYTFPMHYGNIDSCHASVELAIPDLFYFSMDRTRKNTVDGWGSLTTPFGIFDVLRLKSEVVELDSLYIDSLNMGYAVPRNYIQYKWMGNGFGIPLLQIDEEGLLLTVTYIDSLRMVMAVPDLPVHAEQVRVYPNPTRESLTMEWENGSHGTALISICDSRGQDIYQREIRLTGRGWIKESISLQELNLENGIYLISLTVNDDPPVMKKIIYHP